MTDDGSATLNDEKEEEEELIFACAEFELTLGRGHPSGAVTVPLDPQCPEPQTRAGDTYSECEEHIRVYVCKNYPRALNYPGDMNPGQKTPGDRTLGKSLIFKG